MRKDAENGGSSGGSGRKKTAVGLLKIRANRSICVKVGFFCLFLFFYNFLCLF